MKKVISFCLWGNNPKYCIGAIENVKLAKVLFPEWECWFYCANDVEDKWKKEILLYGGKIIEKGNPSWEGMFWRFEAIAESDVDVILSRDTDSRISIREKLAVDEWLSSNKLFHVMRDHPAHGTVILGGMWGAKNPILKDMKYLIDSFRKGDYWQVDQDFLREVIWPRVVYSTFVHDEIFVENIKGLKHNAFPSERKDYEFVGQVFDENNKETELFKRDLIEFLKRKKENK